MTGQQYLESAIAVTLCCAIFVAVVVGIVRNERREAESARTRRLLLRTPWESGDVGLGHLTDEDRAWLTAHGWRDPDDMSSGQAFLDRYYSPELISSDDCWPWRRPVDRRLRSGLRTINEWRAEHEDDV